LRQRAESISHLGLFPVVCAPQIEGNVLSSGNAFVDNGTTRRQRLFKRGELQTSFYPLPN
jgi:hypothetical protein